MLMQMIRYYTHGFISKSLLLYVIWKNKNLALQIYSTIAISLGIKLNNSWNHLHKRIWQSQKKTAQLSTLRIT